MFRFFDRFMGRIWVEALAQQDTRIDVFFGVPMACFALKVMWAELAGSCTGRKVPQNDRFSQDDQDIFWDPDPVEAGCVWWSQKDLQPFGQVCMYLMPWSNVN